MHCNRQVALTRVLRHLTAAALNTERRHQLGSRRLRHRHAHTKVAAAAEVDSLEIPDVEEEDSRGDSSGAVMEAAHERALRAGVGDIYGIPRAEWLRLQAPARYLGE